MFPWLLLEEKGDHQINSLRIGRIAKWQGSACLVILERGGQVRVFPKNPSTGPFKLKKIADSYNTPRMSSQ